MPGMVALMRNGGIPMWFVLAFGLAALGAAVQYAIRGAPRSLAFARWMMLATGLSVVDGTAADLGATFAYVSAHASEPGWHAALFEGLAESTSPAILGFALLALAAMFVAVGRRRAALAGRDPA